MWRILSQIWKMPVRLWHAYLDIGKPKPRFPNVPEKLIIFVRDHMEEFRRTRQRDHLYLEAAGGVIAQYLHKSYFANDADPFLGAREVNEQGDLWYGFPLRVILIGETLFLLRNCKGFTEICYRLKARDLRASYYEMLAAKIFVRAGFDIDMKPEKQIGQEQKKLGENFDFTAERGRFAVSVEVTALKEKEFYEKTAINALNWKRRQVPKDKPAIIFCVLPSHWEGLGFNLNEWTANVANEFFLSGSRRVNRLVFYLERHIDGPTSKAGGGFITISRSYEHPNPYFPCNFDPIFESRGRSEITELLVEDSLHDTESAKSLARELRTGEFYEWVDSFHDE
jgi:hypothetical protein